MNIINQTQTFSHPSLMIKRGPEGELENTIGQQLC